MVFYPEFKDGAIEQIWHGHKMLRDVPDHLLTPMIKLCGKIFYVGELVQLIDGMFFLPTRWFTKNGYYWALGHATTQTQVSHGRHISAFWIEYQEFQDGLTVVDEKLVAMAANEFAANFLEVTVRYGSNLLSC